MPTALADPPAAPTEQPTTGRAGGAAAPAPGAQVSSTRTCSNCTAPLSDGQDWCLQCGTGAPDSLRSHAPTWRSAAVILTMLAVLVAGAAGAAYAALSKGAVKPRHAVTTVAQAPAPATATPVVPPASGVPGTTTTAKIGTPTTIKAAPGLGGVKAPNIPLPTGTPKIPAITPPSVVPGAKTKTPARTPKSTKQTPVPAGEAHPQALLLDTNAASTYNPYNYNAANFGDPSLAIDGDASTGWTALVEPTVAPKLAEGLIVDLNTARRLSALALTSSTPEMTIRVYGANGQTPPASITDPAWIALSPSLVEHKKRARITLGANTANRQAASKSYRFIVLWISQAPASAVGTPQAPGRVSVNELELFARAK